MWWWLRRSIFYGVRDRGVKGRVLIWGGSTLNNESTREGSSGPEDVATLIVGRQPDFERCKEWRLQENMPLYFADRTCWRIFPFPIV